MKKLVFGIITILSFSTLFAQESEILSGKISTNKFSIDIPSEVRSNLVYGTNSFEFTKTERYISELKGSIIIITDSKNYIVAVVLPSSTSEERAKSIGNCFTSGFWNSAGGTGWSGFWKCLVN